VNLGLPSVFHRVRGSRTADTAASAEGGRQRGRRWLVCPSGLAPSARGAGASGRRPGETARLKRDLNRIPPDVTSCLSRASLREAPMGCGKSLGTTSVSSPPELCPKEQLGDAVGNTFRGQLAADAATPSSPSCSAAPRAAWRRASSTCLTSAGTPWRTPARSNAPTRRRRRGSRQCGSRRRRASSPTLPRSSVWCARPRRTSALLLSRVASPPCPRPIPRRAANQSGEADGGLESLEGRGLTCAPSEQR
jgi:hypothetical protein